MSFVWVNKYTIISEYSSGRQGIIYEVSRISDNTCYALKVVKHHRKINVKQIVDNYLIASKSGIGPNVIDSGQCREGDIKYSYIVMTLLSGPSLKINGYLEPRYITTYINMSWTRSHSIVSINQSSFTTKIDQSSHLLMRTFT